MNTMIETHAAARLIPGIVRSRRRDYDESMSTFSRLRLMLMAQKGNGNYSITISELVT